MILNFCSLKIAKDEEGKKYKRSGVKRIAYNSAVRTLDSGGSGE